MKAPGIRYLADASEVLTGWSPVPREVVMTGAVDKALARDPFGVNPAIPRFLRLRFERN